MERILNGVWVRKLKKAFVVWLTVDLNMCHSLPGIEKGQDDPYDNIQSQRQLGPFSQVGGCKEYNVYDNLSVVLMYGNET
jgi:hypothetical protein